MSVPAKAAKAQQLVALLTEIRKEHLLQLRAEHPDATLAEPGTGAGRRFSW